MIQYASELKLPYKGKCFNPSRTVIYPKQFKNVSLGIGVNEDFNGLICLDATQSKKGLIANVTAVESKIELFITIYNSTNSSVVIEQNEPLCNIIKIGESYEQINL